MSQPSNTRASSRSLFSLRDARRTCTGDGRVIGGRPCKPGLDGHTGQAGVSSQPASHATPASVGPTYLEHVLDLGQLGDDFLAELGGGQVKSQLEDAPIAFLPDLDRLDP